MYINVFLAVLCFAAAAALLRLAPFKLSGRPWGGWLGGAAAVNLWLLAALGFSSPFAPITLGYFGLVNGLFLMTVSDLRQREVYDLHFLALLPLGLVSAFWQAGSGFWLMYLTFAILLAVLYLVSSKRADLGWGDSKMIACLALYFPFTRWLEVMMLALGAALLFGLGGILLKKLTARTEFAFMPFLLLGVLLEFVC